MSHQNRTKNQKYSEAVFQNIQKAVNKHGSSEEMEMRRYKSLCKRAGGELRTSGLLQFLTFVKAKSKDGHYKTLLLHLQTEANSLGIVRAKNEDDFLEKIRKQELPAYMKTTREILFLLQWHKRIASIMIEGTAEDTGD